MHEIVIHEVSNETGGSAYLDSELKLPASREDIDRALSEADISSPHYAYEYSFRQAGLNHQLIDTPEIDSLNVFAGQLANLSEYERIKLEGAVLLTNCQSIDDCTTLMHNLECFDLTPNVDTHEALGRHFAENDFADSVEKISPAMMEHFDYDLLGRMGWDEDTNVFIKGHRILDTEHGMRKPVAGHDPNASSLKMLLCSDANPEGVLVKFPLAGTEPMDTPEHGDEMRVAMASLGVDSLEGCRAAQYISAYPSLCGLVNSDEPLAELLWKAQNFGYAEDELSQHGTDSYAKFAAMMEYENCTSLELAVDLTQNLNCYDFAPNIESYAEKHLENKGVDPALIACFDLKKLGDTLAAENNAVVTSKGVISLNGNEFVYDYCQPTLRREQRQETEIRLYCPLKIQVEPESELGQEYGEVSEPHGYAVIPNYVASSYEDDILAAIKRAHLPEEGARGLAHYLGFRDEPYANKVSCIWPSVEVHDNELYGVITVRLTQDLSTDEMAGLTDYITGQMSDGWGESFEQRPVQTQDGELYVSFWQHPGYYLKPEQEFMDMFPRQEQGMQMT